MPRPGGVARPAVAAWHLAIFASLGVSNIGPNATLLSGGCHLAFGPMQPGIRADFTLRNASRHAERAWSYGGLALYTTALPQRDDRRGAAAVGALQENGRKPKADCQDLWGRLLSA